MLVRRLEDGSDGSTPVIHGELDGAVVHVEDKVVPPPADSRQDARQVPRLDHHRDVKIETDPEPRLRPDSSSLVPEEVAGLDLLRAGDDHVVVGPLSAQRLHPCLSVLGQLVFQVSETANEAGDVPVS